VKAKKLLLKLMSFTSHDLATTTFDPRPAIIVEESGSSHGFFSLFLDEGIDKCNKDMIVIKWHSPSYKIPALAEVFSSESKHQVTKVCLRDSLIEEAWEKSALLLNKESVKGEYVNIDDLSRLKYQGIDLGPSIISEVCRFYPNSFIAEKCSLTTLQNIIFARIYARMVLDELLTHFNVKGLFLTEWTYRIQDLVQYSVSKDICVPQYLEGIPFCHLQESKINGGLYSPKSGYGYAIARRASLSNKRWDAQDDLIIRKTMAERVKSATHIHRTTNKVLDKSRRFIKSEFDNYVLISSGTTSIIANNKNNVILYLHAVTDGLFNYGYDGYASPYHYFRDVACSIAAKFRENCNIIVKPHPNLFHKDDSAYPSARELSSQEGSVTQVLLLRMLKELERYNCGIYLLDPNISVDQWTREVGRHAVHVTQFGKVTLETLWLGQRTIYSEMAPYAGIGMGGWTWQWLQGSPDRLCNIFCEHHDISPSVISQYLLTNEQEHDIHIPKRKWIAIISEKLGVPIESLSYLLSNSQEKEKLREAARKTSEFDFVMKRYVHPVLAALSKGVQVTYPLV